MGPPMKPTVRAAARLSYRARRAWSIVALLVALPLYVVVAVSVIGLFDRPPVWAEFLIYLVLGLAWALPLRFVFLGIGRADPDAPPKPPEREG